MLAENLETLMASRAELSTFRLITDASGGELTNGTLDRIRRKLSATSVDNLGALARVFGVQPWQLLVERLNPEALPILANAELSSHIRQIAAQEVAKLLPNLTAHPQTETPDSGRTDPPVDKNSGRLLERLKRLDGVKGERSKPVGTPKPRRGGGA